MLLKYEEEYYGIHSFIHLIWSLSACDKPDLGVIIGSSTNRAPNEIKGMCHQLIRKDPVAGRDWRQEKGATEDEMVGWHHWLNGHEFAQVPGVGDGQGSLACCSPWGRKELNMTQQLNWTEQNVQHSVTNGDGGTHKVPQEHRGGSWLHPDWRWGQSRLDKPSDAEMGP